MEIYKIHLKYEKEIKQKFLEKAIGLHHFGDIDQQQAVEKVIDELIDEIVFIKTRKYLDAFNTIIAIDKAEMEQKYQDVIKLLK